MIFFAKNFSELTNEELYGILKARFQIFVTEQKFLRLDPDGHDTECLHCFLTENDTVVACLRAEYTDKNKKEVKIGRIVTLTHGGGIGKHLITESLVAIRSSSPFEKLSAHLGLGYIFESSSIIKQTFSLRFIYSLSFLISFR